ncbi:hypothetical protein DFH28DRAFT_880440 [Melampsora americana]|nr:hypothetical protein DFH28DRAFT_880440 [Melampsora americana]
MNSYPNESTIYPPPAAVAPEDLNQPGLLREPSGKLKNPYEGVEDEDRSGTPTQPNLQQSYFAISHPDSMNSMTSPTPISLNSRNPISPKERAQRTLSVMNGESKYNEFHGF